MLLKLRENTSHSGLRLLPKAKHPSRRVYLLDRIIIGTRILGFLLFFGAIAYGMSVFLPENSQMKQWLMDSKQALGFSSLLFLSCTYALLLAIPFVPGLEVGIAIMLIFGSEGVLSVYLASVVGFNLAFLFGRHMPSQMIIAIFQQKLKKPSKLDDYFTFYKREPFKNFAGFFRKYRRAFSVILLLNMPGNFIFGGGGGISFICGMDRRYSWQSFMKTILIAAAPIPVLCIFGIINLEHMF